MVELLTLAVLAMLVVALVGSVVPLLPAGALALAAVYVEFLFGPDRLPLWLLASLTVVGLLAVAVDLFGGAIAARSSGASRTTTAVAAVVGLALFLVTGPVGIVLGVFGTVLLAELRQDAAPAAAVRSAVWGAAGILASNAAVFLLVASMAVSYLAVLLWSGL